ncbi:MAG: histidinol-phosphatase [Bacteroidales bacterium]|mgnify:CR=1 FL=1|jgi:histidinol-phosphatase (PHP family)|nr:histidinol-phosphatase [Bacteroidales bacterium]HOI31238.1 histidinol-phosphatase [Bacteroidales bacterium]
MITQNLHTHTIFSDGKSTPEEVVKSAIDSGLQSLGFSDHAPVPFLNSFSIAEGELSNYIAKIEQLKTEFANRIEIMLSLEVDHIPVLMDDFFHQNPDLNLDYTIGSVHLVGADRLENLWFIDGPKREIYDDGLQQFFGGDIRMAVKAFYHQTNRMLEQQTPDIIGHLDKIKMHNQNRFFREDETWYRNLVRETLRLIKEKDVVAELNTRGKYKGRSDSLFPSDWILKEMKTLNIPVIISSDAHQAHEVVLLFDEAVEALKNAGYRSTWNFQQKQWQEIALL